MGASYLGGRRLEPALLESFKNKLDTYLQGTLGPAVEQEGRTN